MKLHIRPSRIRGVFAVPGSKSHTIRGLMAALAAEGTSKLTAPLYSADTLAVRKAAETLGMTVREVLTEHCKREYSPSVSAAPVVFRYFTGNSEIACLMQKSA